MDHDARIADIQKDPQAYAKYQRGMKLWQKYWGKFLWALVLTLLGGWVFLPLNYWLWVLAFIAVSFLIFKKYTFWLITESGYQGPG